jgi:hypothetical protein
MDWQDLVTLCAIFAKRKNLIPKNQKTATRGRLGQLRQVTNFSETASKNRLRETSALKIVQMLGWFQGEAEPASRLKRLSAGVIDDIIRQEFQGDVA